MGKGGRIALSPLFFFLKIFWGGFFGFRGGGGALAGGSTGLCV